MSRQRDYARDATHPDRRMLLVRSNQSVASTWLISRFMIDAPAQGPEDLDCALHIAPCEWGVGGTTTISVQQSRRHWLRE
ncbi:hypothetical protein ASPCADRAFT_205310 [Aspergillus carbonarius ITEM 5010]|uniref:Uncharacterized protein n=1 Tax=Aspergillus carbonarius (strain ITEM 5010) TaxID=602072 RepID=A0A1R3RU99_ASPC5|nr:hypothetical protein ASPCADRAFT_205310 [Aspergillus carbonarius ITEM 5010]